MTRRILLLATSFGLLLGACLLYWRIFGFEQGSPAQTNLTNNSRPALELATRPVIRDQGKAPTLTAGRQPHYVNRDKEGKLLQVVDAEEWVRQDDGSYAAKKPVLEMYMKDGASLHVRGDSGTFFVEETKGSPKLNRGSLAGNVECLLDRGANQPKETMAARPGDIVRIKLDDADFDDSLLTIRSDGQVDLTSYEMDLHGRGMEMALNELPQELRYLKITQGQSMTIRVDSQLAQSQPAGPARTRATPRPSPSPVARAGKNAGKTKPDAGPRQNQYFARFDSKTQNIRITSAKNSLNNAAELSMWFEWDTNRRSSSTAANGNGHAGSPGRAPAAAGRPKLAEVPTVITWTGPMELTPVGYVATPDKNRHHIIGRGDNLVLEDEQSKIDCGNFDFTSPEGVSVLTAAKGRDVHMVTYDRSDPTRPKPAQEVYCREVRMYQDQGPNQSYATLTGPGRMLRPYEPPAGQPVPAGAEPKPDSIAFRKKADIYFDQASSSKPGKTGKMDMVVRKAVFDGPVEMDRPTTGDHMKCEEGLVAEFGQVEGLGNQLLSVEAVGDVLADYASSIDANGQAKPADQQETSHIKAKRLVLQFKSMLITDKNGIPITRDGKSLEMKPSHLEAFEDVHVERAKPDADPLLVSTKRLDADVINRTATLTGKDSQVTQGLQSIVGDEIFMDDNKQVASVPGKGRMTFPARRKADGDKPGPVQIAHMSWTGSMDFDGVKNIARFNNDATFDRGLDHIVGQSITVYFDNVDDAAAGAGKKPGAKPKATPKAKAAPAANAPLNVLNVEGLGSRMMARVTVRDKVEVLSREMDDQKHLTRVIQILSDNLEYDLRNELVTVTDPGMLQMWDLNKPKASKPAAGADNDDPFKIGGSSPAQTVFRWSKVMRMSQKELTALFDGDVVMKHLSGKYIDLKAREKKGWNVIDWGLLEKGQQIGLRCDNLEAKFDPDESAAGKTAVGKAATKPAPADLLQGDALMVTLRSFQATGGVNMDVTSGTPTNVLCELLKYDAVTKIADVYGYLPGQPQRKAIITQQGAVRPNIEQAPEIHWNRKINKFDSRNMSSVGTR